MALQMFFVLSLLLAMTSPSASDNNPGTTPHIQDICIGRCYDYSQIKYKSVLPQASGSCEELADKFFTAFSHQPPCSLSMAHYQPFMDAAKQALPEDKALFWSGVKQLAHEYAGDGRRFVTLEDTLIGYLVDGLVWCGQGSPPGQNYSRCPSWNDCPLESSESFWAAASKAFAESARGRVTVMTDGSRADRPAYRRDSFFGKYELPFLNKALVTSVDVILTHPLDQPAVETCENGSLVQLMQDVTARGFNFNCEDDPQAILHLLCADDPVIRECQLVTKYMFPGRGDSEKYHPNHPPVLNSKPNLFESTGNTAGLPYY
ncbi:hypothetical protein V1264_010324 [Littorina saxatilis]